MGCQIIHGQNFGIAICSPTPILRKIISGDCPDCKKHTRFLTWFFEWYGPTQVCLRCGRTWMDDQWMPLAFERGSRAKSIARAKARWRRETAEERKKCQKHVPADTTAR